MAITKTANAEPIPGYRLIEPLGSGGFGEVWKCTAPGGFTKAIKFVAGAGDHLPHGHALARQELTALEHVREIRHPFLLSMERVEVVDGELCIIMELADSSLQDLLAAYQEVGRSGIPRDELLGYLCEAAEVLDVLNAEHGLQHLDVKPGNLFLVGDHVKVADFGLVQAHRGAGESGPVEPPHGLSPLYAAPEVFQNRFSGASDQYSLAIVYYELLTGQLPFAGKNFRQLMLQHATALPNLAVVPPEDRPMLAKALAKQPAERFASCLAFAEALLSGKMVSTSADTTRVTKSRALRDMRRRLNATGSSGEIILGESPTSTCLHEAPSSDRQPSSRETTSDANLLESSGTVTDRRLVPEQPRPSFHFVQSLSENPLGSWWRAEDEQGQSCLVKMLGHYAPLAADEEARSAFSLQQLAHPGVLTVRRVVKEPGRMLLVSDLIPVTLWGRWQRQSREAGAALKREELLPLLRQVATTLDEVAQTQGLYHWTLNPQNVLLDGDRVLLAELGLAQLFWQKSAEPLGALNPRCSAPELFVAGAEVDGRADVFSLGVIYLWLMTGQCPFRAQSTTRAGAPTQRRKIELDALARPDRRPVAKALQEDPRQRFATCGEFINALEKAWGKRSDPSKGSTSGSIPAVDTNAADVPGALREVVEQLAKEHPPAKLGNGHHFTIENNALVHACGVRLVPGMFELKLRDFRQRWQAEVVSSSEREVRLRILTRTNGLWNRLMSRERGLALTIAVAEPAICGASLTSLQVRMQTFGCEAQEIQPLLMEAGPPILESLRASLLAGPERRQHSRHPYEFPLAIAPLQNPAKAQQGMGKDISVTGLGLRVPEMPPSRDVVIFLPVAGRPRPLQVPARVVRMQACLDGGFELGVRFRLTIH